MGEDSGNSRSEVGLEVPGSCGRDISLECVCSRCWAYCQAVLTWGWESGMAQYRPGLSCGLGVAKGKAQGRAIRGLGSIVQWPPASLLL